MEKISKSPMFRQFEQDKITKLSQYKGGSTAQTTMPANYGPKYDYITTNGGGFIEKWYSDFDFSPWI